MRRTIGEDAAIYIHDYLRAICADQDSYVQKYSGRRVSTLFKFNEAVSPHVAARGADLLVSSHASFIHAKTPLTSLA